MDQMKSCYYQPHNRELVCQCQYGEDNSFLHLRLTEFMDRARQEVSKYIKYSTLQSLFTSVSLSAEVKALFIKIPQCYIDPQNTPPQTQLRQHYLFTKSRLIFFSCHKQVENKQKCFFSITVGDDELNIQNTYLDIDIADAWPPTIWRLIILE